MMLRRLLLLFLVLTASCAGREAQTSSDTQTDVQRDIPSADDALMDALPDDLAEPGPDPSEAEAPEDPGGHDAWVSEVTTPKGYCSARRTTMPLDMIGGDNAWGIRGKSFILENDLVRFLIQDAQTAVHLGVYGGTLIDADLRRKSPSEGNDQFRELFPMVGFRVTRTQKVEVIKDGSDGTEAIVRVSGPDDVTGITRFIDDLGKPLNVMIRTDYILRPNVPYLLIRTEVENLGPGPLQDLPIGDFISFGGASRVFTPEGGFTGNPQQVHAMVSTGRGASYGYTVSSGTILMPYQESNATVAIIGTNFSVPTGGKAYFDRYFIVGKGDIASVLAEVHKIQGAQVVEFSGSVTDEGGKPLEGATVTAFQEGQGEPGKGHALNQAITGPDGTFTMTLPQGKYDFVASAPGRLRVVKKSVDIAKFSVDFQFGPPGKVGLDIVEVDHEGKSLGHIPAKASFYCKDGGERPWDELGERERYGLCAVLFQTHGTEVFPVKPGHYRVIVSRGIEYERVEIPDFEVKAGETSWLEASLLRSVDTSGWMCADLHQHTFGSIDSEMSHKDKVIENLAEGVEVAAVTDHDNMTSYKPAILALGVEDLIVGLDSDEVSASGRGHFNIFEPTGTKEELDPYRGAQLFAFKTIPELFALIRTIPGVRLIQVNHPRDGLDAYFSFSKYDPVTGLAYGAEETMTEDFDIVEVRDSLGSPEDFLQEADEAISTKAKWGSQDIPVMRDWFSFLNRGMNVCAVGVSDAHNRNDGVGYSRTFLRLGQEDPKKVTFDLIVEAIKAQRAQVSNGPFIRYWVGDTSPMGHLEVVRPGDDGTLTVEIEIQAASWIDVNRLEVYANGRPVRLQEVAGVLLEIENPKPTDPLYAPIPLPNTVPGPVVRLHTQIQLFPKVDTWYVFVVKGSGNLEPVGDGWPFAYTNPLYVDVDGDGFEPQAH